MVRYTHVSRVNTAAADAVAKVWTVVETPNVEIPTTLDDLRTMLDKSEWIKPVNVVLNEQSPTHKQKITDVPLICKLVIDSIKLITNGKATSKVRSGETVDVDGTFALMVADTNFGTLWRDRFTSALVQGKDAKRKLAEEYLASVEAE